ncbi:MAG: peptidoglycan editing factor PgeF [Candidatus Korobacteraceae bacterium]
MARKTQDISPAGPPAKSPPGTKSRKQASASDSAGRKRVPKRGGVEVLTVANLSAASWLVHGFSTRQGGVSSAYGGRALNLGPTGEDTPENVARNRERFISKLGAIDASGHPWPVISVTQIHSAIIHRVDQETVPPLRGDGLITSTPGILLGIKAADCLPVLIADPERRAVGAFHAGWRGTAQRIVEKGVGEMRKHFGSDPAKLLAAIGPGIGSCCYEIGDEVEHAFESQFTYWQELFEDVFDSRSLHARYPLLFLNQRAPGHGDPALSRRLNLVKANLLQLRDAGVAEENISNLDLCTACRTDLFFSYRKEHVVGRMMAVVGIRP